MDQLCWAGEAGIAAPKVGWVKDTGSEDSVRSALADVGPSSQSFESGIEGENCVSAFPSWTSASPPRGLPAGCGTLAPAPPTRLPPCSGSDTVTGSPGLWLWAVLHQSPASPAPRRRAVGFVTPSVQTNARKHSLSPLGPVSVENLPRTGEAGSGVELDGWGGSGGGF